jgi:transcription initiation factor TFIIE subunit beta
VVDSKDAIISEMQRHAKKGSGVSIKLLKESWKGSLEAIIELEEQGKVIVIRSGKDNQPKFVFWNTITPEQMEEQKVDEGMSWCVTWDDLTTEPLLEFKKMWHEQVVPEDADVLRDLNSGQTHSLCPPRLPGLDCY